MAHQSGDAALRVEAIGDYPHLRRARQRRQTRVEGDAHSPSEEGRIGVPKDREDEFRLGQPPIFLEESGEQVHGRRAGKGDPLGGPVPLERETTEVCGLRFCLAEDERPKVSIQKLLPAEVPLQLRQASRCLF